MARAAWNFILRFRPCLFPPPPLSLPPSCVSRFRPCPTIRHVSRFVAAKCNCPPYFFDNCEIGWWNWPDTPPCLLPLFLPPSPSLSVNIVCMRVCVCEQGWTKRRWIKKGRLLIVDRICMGNRGLTVLSVCRILLDWKPRSNRSLFHLSVKLSSVHLLPKQDDEDLFFFQFYSPDSSPSVKYEE